MKTEMLYRIMETVSAFYSCHKNEISNEYAKDLDEQSKALLSMIKEQTENSEKESWAEYVHSKYHRRFFKETEFKEKVHRLNDKQLLKFWDFTETATDDDIPTVRWILAEEIGKRFPVEYTAWRNGNNPEYTELCQYVLHSKRKIGTISIMF